MSIRSHQHRKKNHHVSRATSRAMYLFFACNNKKFLHITLNISYHTNKTILIIMSSELEVLKQRITELEAENTELRKENTEIPDLSFHRIMKE